MPSNRNGLLLYYITRNLVRHDLYSYLPVSLRYPNGATNLRHDTQPRQTGVKSKHRALSATGHNERVSQKKKKALALNLSNPQIKDETFQWPMCKRLTAILKSIRKHFQLHLYESEELKQEYSPILFPCHSFGPAHQAQYICTNEDFSCTLVIHSTVCRKSSGRQTMYYSALITRIYTQCLYMQEAQRQQYYSVVVLRPNCTLPRYITNDPVSST